MDGEGITPGDRYNPDETYSRDVTENKIARNRRENKRRVIILEEIRERRVSAPFGMECIRNFWLRNQELI